jgi:hypothetical protein
MKVIRFGAPLTLLVLAMAAPAAAQQFEGIVTIRSAHLGADLVAEQIGEDADEGAREKLFAMSLDQVAQVGGPADVNSLQFKGGRMRSAPFEMPGLGAGYMLFDLTSGMMRTTRRRCAGPRCHPPRSSRTRSRSRRWAARR